MIYELTHIGYSWKIVAAISVGAALVIVGWMFISFGRILFYPFDVIDPIDPIMRSEEGIRTGIASSLYGFNDAILYFIFLALLALPIFVFVIIFLLVTAMIFLYNFFAQYLGGLKMEIQYTRTE